MLVPDNSQLSPSPRIACFEGGCLAQVLSLSSSFPMTGSWAGQRPTPSSLHFGTCRKGQPNFSSPPEVSWGLCCNCSSTSTPLPCFLHSITGVLRTLLKQLLPQSLHLSLFLGSWTKVALHIVCWRSVALFQILSSICPFLSFSTATALSQATTSVLVISVCCHHCASSPSPPSHSTLYTATPEN